MKNFFKKHKIDIIIVIAIFSISLFIGNLYIQNNKIQYSSRADSGKYITTAYNIKYHDTFSQQTTENNEKPTEKSTLAKGYPLLLTLFINKDEIVQKNNYTSWEEKDGFQSLLLFQTLLTAFTVVFIFIISRQFFSSAWSLVPTTLTLFNPHLIMMSGFVLTETTFIFTLTLGILIFLLAWKYSYKSLFLIAGLILGICFETRTIGIGLPIIFLILIIQFQKEKFTKSILLTTGIIIILISELIFSINYTTKDLKPAEIGKSPYETIISIVPTIKNMFTPIDGYIQLLNNDPNYNPIGKTPITNQPFIKYPMEYISWALIGKLVTMWNINGTYTNEIYIYPMISRPYQDKESPTTLKAIYKTGIIFHWPLFILSILGVIFSFLKIFQKKLQSKDNSFIIIQASFLYFIITLYVISAWLPRYTIPIRHLSYLFALIPIYILFFKKPISNKRKKTKN